MKNGVCFWSRWTAFPHLLSFSTQEKSIKGDAKSKTNYTHRTSDFRFRMQRFLFSGHYYMKMYIPAWPFVRVTWWGGAYEMLTGLELCTDCEPSGCDCDNRLSDSDGLESKFSLLLSRFTGGDSEYLEFWFSLERDFLDGGGLSTLRLCFELYNDWLSSPLKFEDHGIDALIFCNT